MCNGVWRCGGCGEIVEGDFTEHAIECVKKEQDLEAGTMETCFTKSRKNSIVADA